MTAFFVAVIDGATAKTNYRYNNDMTPGQMAVHLLCKAIEMLPHDVTAREATQLLTEALHQEDVQPCDRPIASAIIYSAFRHEVWMLGDCQFATIAQDGSLQCFNNEKRIDHLLADWRRDIVTSYLGRRLMTESEVMKDDPGRRIIQHFITQQVRYQNIESFHPLAYSMLDGETMPECHIRVEAIDPTVKEVILASDGYPELCHTLQKTEARLQELLTADPLCLGPLLGTKGKRPEADSFDDRTYIKFSVNNHAFSPYTLS